MDRMWRLLVAIFFLCAALVMWLMCYVFEGTVIAGICVYGMLILTVIGIVKGFYNIWFYHSEDREKHE